MIQKNDLIFFLLIGGIIFLPINLDLFFSFRFTDLFIMSATLTLSFHKISKSHYYLILILIISSAISLISTELKQLETIGMLYKISLPFILFNLLKRLDSYKIRKLNTVLFYVSLFLSIWAITYPFLILNGIVHGNFRPSFPFSDYNISGAHIYSNFLVFSMIAFLEIWFYNKRFSLLKLLISLIFFTGILACGSRNGILILAIYFFLKLKPSRYIKKHKLRIFFITTIAAIIIVQLSNIEIYGKLLEIFERLSSRAVNIDLSDQSSSNRLVKLSIAIDEWSKNGYLFGKGLFSTNLIWYDGLIAHLIAYFGIFSIVFLLLLFNKILHLRKFNKLTSLIFLLYLISNFITEFYLVTRSIFPFLLILFASFEINKNSINEIVDNNTSIPREI